MIKSFIVKGRSGDTILGLGENNELFFSHRPANKIYLSTVDMKSGALHGSEIKPIVVEINFLEGKYFIRDKKTNKIFSSKISDIATDEASFVPTMGIAKDSSLFDIEPVHLPNEATRDFKKVNFYGSDYISDNDKKIKFFWSRNRNGKVNFGDDLNPYLVSHISGLNLERLSKDNIIESELLAVGSILHWAPERDKPYPVWGSGTLGADPLNSGLFKVNLLRGPLTKSLLDIQGNIPFGDPGLLASQVWERSNEEKYDWGIIPHWSQKDSPWVKRLLKDTKNSIVINVNNPDMTQIMSQISSCKHIAATSLHGLVIADSYRIPSVWLWEDNSTRRVQWKYFDYFAGIGRNNIKNVNINKIESLAKIKLNSDEYAYFDKLDSVCSRIISAFPL